MRKSDALLILARMTICTKENLNDNCLALCDNAWVFYSLAAPGIFFCANTVDFLLDHISKSLIV